MPLHHFPGEIHLLVCRGECESRLEDQQYACGEEESGADEAEHERHPGECHQTEESHDADGTLVATDGVACEMC